MSAKTDFIKYVKDNTDFSNANEKVLLYWTAFQDEKDLEKPMFTENGKLILEFLKNRTETSLWKAKDMAEEMGLTSRTVSGAIRKLVTDGFVDKVGQDPVIYTITEKGKNIVID